MIAPRQQWAHQIAVTSLCWPTTPAGRQTQCSNCTRLLGHERRRYVMTPDQFEQCAKAAARFPYDSPVDLQGRTKVVGIFGGEPLMSPYFPDYVDALIAAVPDDRHRGLWTSVDWRTFAGPKYGVAAPHVRRLLGMNGDRPRRGDGYLNWNMHGPEQEVRHQPILVAPADAVPDPVRRWQLISDCWVNREWSAAYALDHHGQPKFYFCEVASSFARVFQLETGIDVEPGCWDGELTFERDTAGVLRPVGKFAAQILATCGRCGASLPLPGRSDDEQRDDVSSTNLAALLAINSPMAERSDLVVIPDGDFRYDPSVHAQDWRPNEYLRDSE